jgi:urease accessory protein
MAAAVTSSAVRLLGLDPLAVAALQARAARSIDAWALSAAASASSDACDLPAHGGSLTDILSEDHQRWDSRLFVA